MIGLLQRVTSASVSVSNETIAEIGAGLLILVGVEKSDTVHNAERLAQRLLNYRVFSDTGGKMNLSVLDTGGSVLLVPQFTLVADTRKGSRPSFSSAAPPGQGRTLFDELVKIMRRKGQQSGAALAHGWLQTGQFGADMAVSLINDGPVTFNLNA
jgi:D-tyrosyl-tRNA(Tyr) deacylase